MSTKTKGQLAAELESAQAELQALRAAAQSTTAAPVVEVSAEAKALASGANAYFLVNIEGVEIAIRKDTLRYQRKWDALNMLENLEAAIKDPATSGMVDFGEQTCTYALHVGNEKVEEPARTVCGVQVTTQRAATSRANGAGFTRTTPARQL